MFSKNSVTLVGNIGKVEILENDGKKMAIVNIATNENWKNADGEKQERTTWTRCVAFSANTVNFIEKYLTVGRYVHAEGSLRNREYEQDGERKFSTEVILSDISPLDKKPGQPDTTDEAPAEPKKARAKK